MDNLTAQQFAATRDSLRPASITALIDFYEGNVFALFSAPWIFDALEKRGLVDQIFPDWDDLNRLGMKPTRPIIDLTDYGRAFVAWYRQPRDLPAQLDIFDAL